MPHHDVSVLLPVHAGIRPEHLADALQSIAGQTVQPRELVLVEDGPLDAAHHRVVDAFDAVPLVRVVLPVNRGPGVANQRGLEAASGHWIAKADADDLSRPDRLERQLLGLEASGDDVCGSAMLEFDDDPARPTRLRTAPLTTADIRRRVRINNPMNHPTLVYAREVALAAGGYPDLRFGEDYDLVARMLARGARMSNLAEPLVLFRAGPEMRSRRTGWALARAEIDLQDRLLAYGLITRVGWLRNVVVRGAFHLLPDRLMSMAYARVLSGPAPPPTAPVRIVQDDDRDQDGPAMISVCMATYDGASFVEEQLASILRQLGPDDEVVVVDDASHDATPDLVAALGDPRIRLVRLPHNVGYVRAFEQALELARGEHLFLSDQDDVWPDGRVTTMVRALERSAVVAGNLAVLGGPDRLRGPFGERDWRLRSRAERRTWRNVVRLGASDLPYYGSAMAVRRDALSVALPFPPQARELHDAWLALVGMFLGSLGHVEERVVQRRVHDHNTTGTIRSVRLVLRGRWWYVQMVREARRRARARR